MILMNKYPNLTPIDRPPSGLTGTKWSRTQKTARSVCARVGCRAWIDLWRRIIVFGREVGDSIVLFEPAVRLSSGFNPFTGDGEDDIVRLIGYSKASERTKARWNAEYEQARKAREAYEVKHEMESRHKEAASLTEHRYQQHSMGKHYRKTVALS